MERIAQNDLRTHTAQLFGRHRFDGSVRAHRHERGRLDDTPPEAHTSSPREAVSGKQIEFQSSPTDAEALVAACSINIASP